MRVLLTGATGFVGTALTRVLVRERCDVYALLPETATGAPPGPGVRVLRADLRDRTAVRDAVARSEPEVCFHLAWYTEPGKYLEDRINLDLVAGSLGLVQELIDAGCRRVIAAGTCFEYDTTFGYLSETCPTRPRTLYAACKLSLATMLDELHKRGVLELAWLRLFFLYGPGEHPRRLVSSLVTAMLQGREAPLTHGEQVRDFLHVEDAAEAFWAVCLAGTSGVVNVGSARPVTVRHVAETIAHLIGRPDLLRVGALPAPVGDPPVVCARADRLQQLTAWRERYDLTTGLQHTIAWWRDALQLPATT